MTTAEAITETQELEAVLAHIDRIDPQIASFVEVLPDRARAELRRLPRQPIGALHGVPVAIKELFDVQGGDNSYGSLVRAGLRATSDGEIVSRLVDAGALIIGLTRSHEYGWGITTQHGGRGSTKNPRNPSLVPGGSSGGSAAAVAAGLVPLAVGTDTGGSIRIPAAFCGVLGLKTTPGRISRAGCVPLAPTFDTPGFLARSIRLLRAGLRASVGQDFADPLTVGAPSLPDDVAADRSFTFAVPDELQPASASTARVKALREVAAALTAIGGRECEAHPPHAQHCYEVFVPHQMAEAHFIHSRVLATWPVERSRYGSDIASRLDQAASVSIEDYLEAKDEARSLAASFRTTLATVDILVSLVGATGPSTVTSPDVVELGGRLVPLREATMPSTTPQNIAGLPSLTFPAGTVAPGEPPVGVQITGAPWSETMLLDIGRRLERAGAFNVEPSSENGP